MSSEGEFIGGWIGEKIELVLDLGKKIVEFGEENKRLGVLRILGMCAQ